MDCLDSEVAGHAGRCILTYHIEVSIRTKAVMQVQVQVQVLRAAFSIGKRSERLRKLRGPTDYCVETGSPVPRD